MVKFKELKTTISSQDSEEIKCDEEKIKNFAHKNF